MNTRYELETVECPDCEGRGEILWDMPDVWARCSQCWGTGDVEVCAQCYDSGDPCGACGLE